MTPPHLPPKTSNIENHRIWQRLKFLLATAVFSLIVGASGASIMLGWIWPRFAEGDTWITSYTRPAMSRIQLETRVREEVASRVMEIHRGTSVISGVNYFNKKIGDGIVLSSDGWLAVYQPQYDGVYKNIYVAAKDGSVYQAQNAIWDKYSGILYLKIQNEQFKVAGFADENSAPDEIFVWQNNNWYHSTGLYQVFDYKIPHLDTAPIERYSVNGNFSVGDIVVNNQGRVAGFISENGLLLPSTYITRILSKVLSQQNVSYPSLGVEGWFSGEQIIFSSLENQLKAGEKIQGFLVSNVWLPSSLFRKGDVILEINGRIVFSDNLWYSINANENVNVKILRNGKELELNVKIAQTK
ncbi:MAG: serine protease [Candidatus Magasanikbacteria bacterium]|nr:serine protease [Candidatus Magasanikbacteria bacterium]